MIAPKLRTSKETFNALSMSRHLPEKIKALRATADRQLLNGIEAMSGMSEGPRELQISTAKTDSEGVLVTVRDSGPGLAPESVDRLFEPFYTTKPGGLGMGLSICRSIIEAHQGRLWASANAPRGAIFQFTLLAQSYAGQDDA
jgi:signal transduction histidine kinase